MKHVHAFARLWWTWGGSHAHSCNGCDTFLLVGDGKDCTEGQAHRRVRAEVWTRRAS